VARIAVIDSDATLLRLTSDLFVERGWETVADLDPDTAPSALALSPPDVIVMDIWLTEPDSGWPILRRLRENPATRDIPVLVWSAIDAQLLDKDGWLREQRIPILGKPFELVDLFTAVESALASGCVPRGA
jgi:CheY-like chemotaxis protein